MEQLTRCYASYANLIIESHKDQSMEDDNVANCLKRFWDTESINISELTTNEEVKDEPFEIDDKRVGEYYSVKCLSSSALQISIRFAVNMMTSSPHL